MAAILDLCKLGIVPLLGFCFTFYCDYLNLPEKFDDKLISVAICLYYEPYFSQSMAARNFVNNGMNLKL